MQAAFFFLCCFLLFSGLLTKTSQYSFDERGFPRDTEVFSDYVMMVAFFLPFDSFPFVSWRFLTFILSFESVSFQATPKGGKSQ